VFARVAVDEAVCTAGCEGGGEDAFAFLAGPLAFIFPQTEGFDGARGHGSFDGLRDALLTLVAMMADAVAPRWRRRVRVRPAVVIAPAATTTALVVSGAAGSGRAEP
jgi:hypothetical protein